MLEGKYDFSLQKNANFNRYDRDKMLELLIFVFYMKDVFNVGYYIKHHISIYNTLVTLTT